MADIYDGEWRLFDWDAATGRSVWVLHDQMTGKQTFRVDQPVDELIGMNKAEEAETHGKRFGEWVKTASVPLSLYHSSGLADASLHGDDRFLSRWLNDSDNRAFRTSRGKV